MAESDGQMHLFLRDLCRQEGRVARRVVSKFLVGMKWEESRIFFGFNGTMDGLRFSFQCGGHVWGRKCLFDLGSQ